MEEKREKLKNLLGISEESQEPLLEFALQDAEETVKNYCNASFTFLCS